MYFYKKREYGDKGDKGKIYNAIDNIPDEILEDVLEYLKTLTKKSTLKIKLSQNLRKILDEDKDLLEKLAQ